MRSKQLAFKLKHAGRVRTVMTIIVQRRRWRDKSRFLSVEQMRWRP
jgi:hypothetical protein